MKRILYSFIFLFITSSVVGQDSPEPSPILSGGYLPGVMGVRDYAYPGVDGLFVFDYNIFLSANSFNDRTGNKANSLDLFPELGGSIPLDIDISGYINSLMFIYASPKLEFLGNAQYLFIAAPNFTTANLGVGLGQINNGNTINGGASGFGDITIAPLTLSWEAENFDFTTSYLFVAPTGKYATGADDNVGIGYWSHIVQAAGYYYLQPEKATALMIIPSYEWHSNLKDANVKPGSRFILEYGISHYLTERFEITLQGGHAWQIGEDSGGDVYWDTSVKDQMNILGGGIGYWIKPNVFYLNAKYSTTYNNKQHFNANTFQIQLILTTDLLRKKDK